MKDPRIKALVALAHFCLTLVGVAGFAYKIFNPEGWLVQLFGYVWDIELHFSLIAVPVLIVAILLGLKFFTRLLDTKSGALGNLLTGAFMALGLYYIVRLIFFDSL